jgi:hypothetical protein
MGGNNAAMARMAVDLPVPRSPKAKTPPILGSTQAIRKASFISSWPTIAEKGKIEAMRSYLPDGTQMHRLDA